MKQFLLVFCLLLLSSRIFAQQFSQINTGTLYDSFENPAQRSFIPDSSKSYAFNFLFPNLTTNFYLTGNAQATLKSRAFSNYFDTGPLQIGQGRYNHINLNANAYSIMFKVFSSLNGNQEIGFSLNTKVEGRALASDETIAIFNGATVFPNNSYDDIFNDRIYYQVYQQMGFTYREQINKNFALGIKFNALSGADYDKVQIDHSHIDFNKQNNSATLFLQGTNYSSGSEGRSYARTLIPAFHNPGASVSIGTQYKTQTGYLFQANIKDLGFIHWNKTSSVYNFNNLTTASGVNINKITVEDSIYKNFNNLIKTNQTNTSFNSPTNGLLELSVSRQYWLDEERQFGFSPTLIASKELFYTGFTGALVAPFQYQKYNVTLTTSYSDLKIVNFGGQFMIKTPDAEFFIGSESLFQTGSFFSSAIHPLTGQTQTAASPGAFTGADFFIGFSIKFGPIIEHPMNASTIPNGEKGFLGKIFDRIFPKAPVRNN